MSGYLYTDARQRQVWRIIPDLIRARELLIDLIWKDLRARYRYAVMGFFWAVLEPVALMLVLTFVFSVVFRQRVAFTVGEEGPPFATMVLCGLIFWQFTANGLTSASQALLDNRTLVQKVHFPREVVPLAGMGYPLVNLFIGFFVLLGVHMILGGSLSLALLWFPVVFALQWVMTVGLALLLSCGNVHFRDIGYMVGVAVMFGFYASPVFYPLEWVTSRNVPAWALRAYECNPMAELLTAYRQILFEHRAPDAWLLAWPAIVAAAVLVIGVIVFRRLGPTLSDHL